MPLGPGVRYRTRPLKGGGFERLAFDKSGKVIEAKNLKTGKVHTPAEFAADRARPKGSTMLTAGKRGHR